MATLMTGRRGTISERNGAQYTCEALDALHDASTAEALATRRTGRGRLDVRIYVIRPLTARTYVPYAASVEQGHCLLPVASVWIEDMSRATESQRKDNRGKQPTEGADGESTLQKQPMPADSKTRTRKNSNSTKPRPVRCRRAARRPTILDISPHDRYVSTQAVRVLTLLRTGG